MPADLPPSADEVGAPIHCNHHAHTLRAMAAHGHVDAEATAAAAADLARQCPHCPGGPA